MPLTHDHRHTGITNPPLRHCTFYIFHLFLVEYFRLQNYLTLERKL